MAKSVQRTAAIRGPQFETGIHVRLLHFERNTTQTYKISRLSLGTRSYALLSDSIQTSPVEQKLFLNLNPYFQDTVSNGVLFETSFLIPSSLHP